MTVHGWDDPAWIVFATDAIREARKLPGAAARQVVAFKVVGAAAKNGPLDVPDDEKKERIRHEVSRALGVFVAIRAAEALLHAELLLQGAEVGARYGARVERELRAKLKKAALELDRSGDASEVVAAEWAERVVADLLDGGLARACYHDDVRRALDESDDVATEERALVFGWFKRVDGVPALGPRAWVDSIIATSRDGGESLADDLWDQFALALDHCETVPIPAGLDRSAVRDRATDKLLTMFRWRERGGAGPIEGSLKAYAKQVMKSAIADEFTRRRLERPVPLDEGLGWAIDPLASDDRPAVDDWIRYLHVFQTDGVEASKALAAEAQHLLDMHPRAAPRVQSIVETSVQIVSRKLEESERALGGDPEASEAVAGFLGGLAQAMSEDADSAARWLRPDVLQALRNRFPAWRDRYPTTAPSSHSMAPGAFDVSEKADDQKERRLRRGGSATGEDPVLADGVIGVLAELFAATVNALEADRSRHE